MRLRKRCEVVGDRVRFVAVTRGKRVLIPPAPR